MDLVTGAKKVIIAMEHCAKDGSSKVLKRCTLPLTAVNAVHMLVTELAVFEFINGKLHLMEIAEGYSIDDVISKTEAEFVVSSSVRTMPLA